MFEVIINAPNLQELPLKKRCQSLEEAQAYLASQLGKKGRLPGECTHEIVDISAQIAQEEAQQEARNYLAATDWYAIRKADTGAAIPEDVSAARQAARELL